MKKVKLDLIVCILGLLVTIVSCKTEISNYLPEQHKEISSGKYQKYLSLLKSAYEQNDKIEAAVQLANLKSENSKIYEMLNAGIKESPDGCVRLYDWYWMYDRHNFGVNILKSDTIQYKESIKLCETLYKESSYQDFALNKDKEMQEAKNSKEKEDSTKFNIGLVRILEQIDKEDQDIRNRLNEKNVTQAIRKELMREMNIIDSINLIKVEKIFEQYGYPSKELVGRECNFTPALVIHHSKDLATRYKHLPLLEDAVKNGNLGEGTLNMIKTRIENIKLDQEQ